VSGNRLAGFPAHLLGESAWRAILHVLTAPRYAREGRIWRHITVNDDEARIDWLAILTEGWSGNTRNLLVTVARLWAHGVGADTSDLPPPVDLDDLLSGLDDDNWRLLVGALALRRAGLRRNAWPLDLAALVDGA
jgi:hypothetical protein